MALIGRPTALVLRALGLGDFLTGVPAMRALRRTLADHEVVLAAPPVLEPLVRLSGVADRLHPAAGLEPLSWRGPAPDMAVNLHGRGPQSHRLLQALSPPRLCAFGSVAAAVPGPGWDEAEHEVSRWCRLVEETLGASADQGDLRLAAPSAAPAVADAVVVHPGAAYPSRRWPPGRFAEVARWAVDQGWPVTVTGSPAERDLAEEVRRTAGLSHDALLAGRTSLLELAALVSAARLVVCGDTGIAHLASALGTPSVVMFGPVSPDRWGPPPDGPHSVIWRADQQVGDPFGSLLDPALASITVAEVLEHAEARVRRAPRDESRTTPASV